MPPSAITATSTRPSAASAFSPLGVRFALLDYDEPATLDAAFAGVSTNTLDNERRRQHADVVEAAERARVGWVVYSSLGEDAHGRIWRLSAC